MANRVSESMISSTSLPRSRKYSAIGRGGDGRLRAQQRRLVAGGHDHHAARQALGAQVALDELVDFAAAFADQAR